MNLSIKEILAEGVSADEPVISVKITATGGDSEPVLSASFNLDLTNGDKNYPFSPSNDITVWLPDTESQEAVTLGELSAWACVIPFEAEELTFVVTTTANTIQKTVTAEQLGGSFSIAEGGIKTFNLTIDDDCTIRENKPVEFILADYGIVQKGYYAGLHNATLYFRSYDPSDYWEGIALTMQALAAMNDDPSLEYLNLPEGTYRFDGSLTDKSVTLGTADTFINYYENDAFAGKYTIKGGTMIVEGDHTNYHIVFEIVTNEAGTIRAEYNGALNIPNPNYLPPATGIDLGELTGALAVNQFPDIWGSDADVDGWEIAFGNAGTFLEYGNYKGTGWVFQTYFYSPLAGEGGTIPDGTYILRTGSAPFSASPGAWGRTSNSWIIRYDYSSITQELPVISGTVTSKFENGLYNMTIDVVTINGDVVTGTVKANPTIVPAPL